MEVFIFFVLFVLEIQVLLQASADASPLQGRKGERANATRISELDEAKASRYSGSTEISDSLSVLTRSLSARHDEVRARAPTYPSENSLCQPEDKWFTKDKFHHFSYSLGITGLSYHVYHCQFNNPNPGAKCFSISLAAITGIGKELYDKFYKKTKISYKDLTADATGIIVGVILFAR